MGLQAGLINGSVVGAARASVAKKFESGEFQVLVASPATMAIGFNFEFVSIVVFVSADYDNSAFHQAFFRGNRGTRSTPLPIYILVVNCKVEKKFWKKVLNEKEAYKNTVDSQLKE